MSSGAIERKYFDFRKTDDGSLRKSKQLNNISYNDIEEQEPELDFSTKLSQWKSIAPPPPPPVIDYDNLASASIRYENPMAQSNGLKHNPLFQDNPGFLPNRKYQVKDDNFNYYRQNQDMNETLNENDKVKVKNGQNLFGSAVINEFRSKYMQEKKEEPKPPEFTFLSMDYTDPTENMKRSAPPPMKDFDKDMKKEDTIKKSKYTTTFDANEILNNYKSKHNYNSKTEYQSHSKQRNELADVKLKRSSENERVRSEKLSNRLNELLNKSSNDTSNGFTLNTTLYPANMIFEFPKQQKNDIYSQVTKTTMKNAPLSSQTSQTSEINGFSSTAISKEHFEVNKFDVSNSHSVDSSSQGYQRHVFAETSQSTNSESKISTKRSLASLLASDAELHGNTSDQQTDEDNSNKNISRLSSQDSNDMRWDTVSNENLKEENDNKNQEAVSYIRSYSENDKAVMNAIPADDTINGTEDETFNLKRSNSSRSNPNVTFGYKNGQEIADEFKTQVLPHEQLMASEQEILRYQSEQFANKRARTNASGTLLFSPHSSNTRRSTDLNQLNFTKMSSKLHRSNNSSTLDSSRKEPRNAHVSHDDQYVVIDNTYRELRRIPSVDRSTVSSLRSSQFSISSMMDSGESREKNRSTVMLARGWSGKIVSTGKETKQKYDYGVKIPAFNRKSKNVGALVFRSNKPIEDVRPKEDIAALSSLNSLDRRLRIESDITRALLNEPMDWIINSEPSTPDDGVNPSTPRFYKESKCYKSDLPALSRHILQTGYNEGQNMRSGFYQSLHKITTIVNQMVKLIPKEFFPFKLKPCSFQGDFEKKGPRKINLYLIIEDLKDFEYRSNFFIKKNLGAYVILKSENKTILKQFCAKHKETGDWVLSSSRVMVVFAYMANTKMRGMFDNTSRSKRKSIPYNAQLNFHTVKENVARFDIMFPGDSTVYNVGLQLALNVTDFPNVIDMNKHRKWPDSHARGELLRGGVHLLSKPTSLRNHTWEVSFLKSRKILLNSCDRNQNITNMLLALQVANNSALSSEGCDGLLLPVHFIMIKFWLREKYQDNISWSRDYIGERFIDILIALKRCLQRKTCPDFFFPALNYFENFSDDESHQLLQNVEKLLNNPMAYADSDTVNENMTEQMEH